MNDWTLRLQRPGDRKDTAPDAARPHGRRPGRQAGCPAEHARTWLDANERHNEFLREQEAQRQRQADYAAQGLNAYGDPKPARPPKVRYVSDAPETAIYYP